jgi:hypothetical protein
MRAGPARHRRVDEHAADGGLGREGVVIAYETGLVTPGGPAPTR